MTEVLRLIFLGAALLVGWTAPKGTAETCVWTAPVVFHAVPQLVGCTTGSALLIPAFPAGHQVIVRFLDEEGAQIGRLDAQPMWVALPEVAAP